MTVKQYLYSVRDEQREIEELNERIYEMRMSLLPGAMRYDTDKVQVSPKDTTDRMAEIAEYMGELKRKQSALTDKRLKDVAEFAGVTSSTICHALKRKEAGLLQHTRYVVIEDIDEEDE